MLILTGIHVFRKCLMDSAIWCQSYNLQSLFGGSVAALVLVSNHDLCNANTVLPIILEHISFHSLKKWKLHYLHVIWTQCLSLCIECNAILGYENGSWGHNGCPLCMCKPCVTAFNCWKMNIKLYKSTWNCQSCIYGIDKGTLSNNQYFIILNNLKVWGQELKNKKNE